MAVSKAGGCCGEGRTAASTGTTEPGGEGGKAGKGSDPGLSRLFFLLEGEWKEAEGGHGCTCGGVERHLGHRGMGRWCGHSTTAPGSGALGAVTHLQYGKTPRRPGNI